MECHLYSGGMVCFGVVTVDMESEADGGDASGG